MSTDAFDVPGVDALFDAELNEFVAARDALVKQRKAEGDKEGAAAVKALRKPSTVAWGVNRVARTQAEKVAGLIEAGGAVRAAQVKAVQGDGAALRDASKQWRAQVNALAGQVGTLIGDQYRDDAAATFEAASIDDALSAILRAGRFTAAVEAAGFGLGGMPDVPVRARASKPEPGPQPQPEPEPRAEPQPAVDPKAREEAEAELASREKKLEQARHRLRRAEQRLDQAREAVDEARLTYEETLAARDRADESLKALTS